MDAQEYWKRRVYRGLVDMAKAARVPVCTFEEWWSVWESRWREREQLGIRLHRIDTSKGFVIGNLELRATRTPPPQVANSFSTGSFASNFPSPLEKSDFMHRFHDPQ